MGNMHKRIAALETRDGAHGPVRWRRVIVDGQSEAEALAAHEALCGPVGRDSVIYRVIIGPVQMCSGSMTQ